MKKKSTIKIGENLQKIRKSNGYTQEMLAERLECSTRYISDIEQNNSKPSYEVLVRFCNAFDIGLDDIFKQYLKVSKEKVVNYELKGYENLKQKDKNTIAHLIAFFNKEKFCVNITISLVVIFSVFAKALLIFCIYVSLFFSLSITILEVFTFFIIS